MVAFAPASQCEPYLRSLYAQIRTDEYPAELGELSFDGCLWIDCTHEGHRCGGFLMVPVDGGFEVNALLLPPARGRVAVALARAAMELFRSSYPDCPLTACVSGNRAAQVFLRATGFVRSKSEDEGEHRNGVPCATTYYIHG